MSSFITEAYVNEFRDNVTLLSQQKMSRLRGAVRVEGFTGEKAFFDQLKPTSMVAKATRHSDTPLVETEHARRMVTASEYEWADLIGRGDKARTLPEFTNPYLINAAAAAGRTMDELIIAAADGTAMTGQAGTTPVSLPSSQVVPNTIGANTGLNIDKLIDAKKVLDKAEVDPTIPRFILANSDQLSNLLRDDQIQSSDYNTVRALVRGEIDTFMGFNFIRSELIRTVSTDHRVLFWAMDGLLLGINYDVMAKVDVRPDKSYDTQAYISMMMGATRMEEEKVGYIECAVTPAANT
jgi:hypothetical protein